jgi:hypothetical protein
LIKIKKKRENKMIHNLQEFKQAISNHPNYGRSGFNRFVVKQAQISIEKFTGHENAVTAILTSYLTLADVPSYTERMSKVIHGNPSALIPDEDSITFPGAWSGELTEIAFSLYNREFAAKSLIELTDSISLNSSVLLLRYVAGDMATVSDANFSNYDCQFRTYGLIPSEANMRIIAMNTMPVVELDILINSDKNYEENREIVMDALG